MPNSPAAAAEPPDEPDDYVELRWYAPHEYDQLIADAVADGNIGSLLEGFVTLNLRVRALVRRLDELGMTHGQLNDLVVHCKAAEMAAESAAARGRPARWTEGPLSPALRMGIVQLHLRGCSHAEIDAVFELVRKDYIDTALAGSGIDDKVRAVVAAHIAGATLSQVVATTQVARSTVEDIIARRLWPERAHTRSHSETAERRAQVRRLKAAGYSNRAIADMMELPLDTVKNDLRPRRKPRAAE